MKRANAQEARLRGMGQGCNVAGALPAKHKPGGVGLTVSFCLENKTQYPFKEDQKIQAPDKGSFTKSSA